MARNCPKRSQSACVITPKCRGKVVHYKNCRRRAFARCVSLTGSPNADRLVVGTGVNGAVGGHRHRPDGVRVALKRPVRSRGRSRGGGRRPRGCRRVCDDVACGRHHNTWQYSIGRVGRVGWVGPSEAPHLDPLVPRARVQREGVAPAPDRKRNNWLAVRPREGVNCEARCKSGFGGQGGGGG